MAMRMRAWMISGAMVSAMAASLAATGPAAARPPTPWCAQLSNPNGAIDCAYWTFEQCHATVWGVGGSCFPNPRYYARRPPPPDGHRKHRRERW